MEIKGNMRRFVCFGGFSESSSAKVVLPGQYWWISRKFVRQGGFTRTILVDFPKVSPLRWVYPDNFGRFSESSSAKVGLPGQFWQVFRKFVRQGGFTRTILAGFPKVRPPRWVYPDNFGRLSESSSAKMGLPGQYWRIS